MPVAGLDHLVIAVSDWERSSRFYRDIVGVELVSLPQGQSAYRVANVQLNLHGPGARPAPLAAKPVEPGNSDLCFVWQGTIDEAVEHLRIHEVEILEGPVPRQGFAGRGTSVYFRDPDGSLLEFIAYHPGQTSSAAPLAYDDRGTGNVIVLIHGHPFDRRMWAPQLAALGDGFRLVAPDLPGYGASKLPPTDTVTMRSLADSVLGLLDTIGVGRATVVGLSMGGLVAMELALAHPERVDGLVLAATTAAPVSAEEARSRRALAAEIEENGMLAPALEMAGLLFGPAARKNPALVNSVFTMMICTPPAGAAAALRGRAERPDYSKLLSGLRVPSLVIVGDDDTYAPTPVVEQLVASLPAPKLVRLPDVGHLPNLEAPEQFNAELRAFVIEVHRARRASA